MLRQLGLQGVIRMGLFSFLSCKCHSENSFPRVLLFDNFTDNANAWIDSSNKSTVLLQKISDSSLCLDSFTDEMGVASSVFIDIDDSKNFSIETKMKVRGKGGLAYACINFGALKLTKGLRNINGIGVPTDLGDKKYYFGFSSESELLVTKWNKGKETHYYRGYDDVVDTEGFNKILIEKKGASISYTINDKIIFTQQAKRLMGNGLGFSVSPNSTLWVDYIKVIN